MSDISEKIRKLLALSKSSNMHEAELALSRANDLMQKHNLSMSDIEIAQHTTNNITEERYTEDFRQHDWVLHLGGACALLFDGIVLINNRYGNRTMTFVGFPDDIAAAKYLFEHLYQSWTGIADCDLAAEKLLAFNWKKSDSIQFMKSHGIGYAKAIKVRVIKILEERELAKQSQATGTALMVLKDEALKEWQVAKRLGYYRSNLSARSAAGQRAGVSAGNRAALGGAIKQTRQIR